MILGRKLRSFVQRAVRLKIIGFILNCFKGQNWKRGYNLSGREMLA